MQIIIITDKLLFKLISLVEDLLLEKKKKTTTNKNKQKIPRNQQRLEWYLFVSLTQGCKGTRKLFSKGENPKVYFEG